MATVLLHHNRLSLFVTLFVTWSHTASSTCFPCTSGAAQTVGLIVGRQLNVLEVKSANVGRAEGSQVEVPVVLVCLADISHCHSSGIMEAPFVGSCLTEFNNKAIFGYKLCHSFLTQQLEEKKEKGKSTKFFFLHNLISDIYTGKDHSTLLRSSS